MSDLLQQQCHPITDSDAAYSDAEIEKLLADDLENLWQLNAAKDQISRSFKFKNYYQTISFVNAVAWVAHQQDHHPEIIINYSQCDISFTTHNVKRLSKNDFICAAFINQLSTH